MSDEQTSNEQNDGKEVKAVTEAMRSLRDQARAAADREYAGQIASLKYSLEQLNALNDTLLRAQNGALGQEFVDRCNEILDSLQVEATSPDNYISIRSKRPEYRDNGPVTIHFSKGKFTVAR